MRRFVLMVISTHYNHESYIIIIRVRSLGDTWSKVIVYCLTMFPLLKVLGKSVGLCKTTKRKDQLYISLLVSVWRIICENFNPYGLILAEI